MSYEEIDDLAPKQNLWDKALARKNVNGKNLLVVDMNNLAYRYKQRGQVDFQEDMIRTVESLAKSYSALHIDQSGSRKHRGNVLRRLCDFYDVSWKS